jgi:queuine/archaeosine tRNA-ribosyltransferase
MRLATLNNLYFYLRLMREIREQIQQGKLWLIGFSAKL